MTMMTSPTEAPLSTTGLAGKSAIVTGSTSGIGLGIARAFAGAGMSVTLNGFGEKAEIEHTRADLEKTFGVRVAYSAADMTKPDEIAGMVTEAAKTFGKVDVLVNNAGIQHVEAIETFPDLQVGRHHRHQPVGGLPRHPRRRARHEGAQVGAPHQHRVRARARRLALQVGLRGRQARHPRPHQDGGAGDGRVRHHRAMPSAPATC